MEWTLLIIVIGLFYVLPGITVVLIFFISQIVAFKTNDKKNILSFFDWLLVLLSSIIPLFNLFLIVALRSETKKYLVTARRMFIDDRNQKQLIKKNPHIQLIDLMENVTRLYKENLNNNRNNFGHYIRDNPLLILTTDLINEFQKVNTFVKENPLHPEIKKILESNEMPFSYVSSLFSEHSSLLDSPENETFQKVHRIIKLYVDKVQQVRTKENQKLIKAEELAREKLAEQQRVEQMKKDKEKQQQELLIKKTEQRVNQDLAVILEAVEKE